MTDIASAFMHYLKTEYQTASIPDLKAWAFAPDNQQQSEVFAELCGQQLIRKIAEGLWGLTGRGLEWVLEEATGWSRHGAWAMPR